MTERQPVHWGSIDAETAKSAAATLERGKRIEIKRFPFDNITIDEDLEAVKKDAEQIIKDKAEAWHQADVSISWGNNNVTKECEGKTPRTPHGAIAGFVVLSDMKSLPWGAEGVRGGIYTWEGEEMDWKLEAGFYLLSFSFRKRN